MHCTTVIRYCSCTVLTHCTHALYSHTVPMHLLQEGGWSIRETKGAKAAFKRLQEEGIPNHAVDGFFKETKQKARAANAGKRKR